MSLTPEQREALLAGEHIEIDGIRLALAHEAERAKDALLQTRGVLGQLDAALCDPEQGRRDRTRTELRALVERILDPALLMLGEERGVWPVHDEGYQAERVAEGTADAVRERVRHLEAELALIDAALQGASPEHDEDALETPVSGRAERVATLWNVLDSLSDWAAELVQGGGSTNYHMREIESYFSAVNYALYPEHTAMPSLEEREFHWWLLIPDQLMDRAGTALTYRSGHLDESIGEPAVKAVIDFLRGLHAVGRHPRFADDHVGVWDLRLLAEVVSDAPVRSDALDVLANRFEYAAALLETSGGEGLLGRLHAAGRSRSCLYYPGSREDWAVPA